jgi:hypothetical protein
MSHFARKATVLLCVLALFGTGTARGEPLPQKPGPKAGKYAAEYREMTKPSWKTNFPNLGPYEVLAPSTGRENKKGAYNCIAHTLRIYSRWVWPGKKVADFDRLYNSHGYKRLRKVDYRFNPKLDKIVLYAKVLKNGQLECTHGARQLADGTWTSKLGGGPLIRHKTPAAVGGPSYGRPIAVYVKVRRASVILPLPSGSPTVVASASKRNKATP